MADAWLGLCEVPVDLCNEHALKPFDTIRISAPSDHPELTTTVLQVVPTELSQVRLHPILLEVLSREALEEESSGGFTILPLPFEHPTELPHHAGWRIAKTDVVDIGEAEIQGTIIYCEEEVTEKDVARGLEGRVVQVKSVLVVSTIHGFAILVIDSVSDSPPGATFRVGSSATALLKRLEPDEAIDELDTENDWETDCPGYESLAEDLCTLCTARGFAAPSGILLAGCAGVGKTRLASFLAHKMSTQDDGYVHWVSCQDLVVRASWASESELLDLLLPKRHTALLVLDDLHALDTDDAEASARDQEYVLVRNSLIATIDQLSKTDTAILGVCRDTSKLPSQLVRIDRLEKVITMEAATQIQREAILLNLMPEHPEWTAALMAPTAGFVAADLHRMYSDAWTSAKARSTITADDDEMMIGWADLREAVHRTAPSQLALLDVTRPRRPIDATSDKSPLEIHRRSWVKFGGYTNVKKRIYRTVVGPWHRYLQSNEPSAFGLNPPRGVLFHGPSGTGKTFAANCLSSSLGLNVVKVRASDVLDQWLGGSEAAIRSLFQRARSAAPCILYFDEIDAIASNRAGTEGGGGDVSSRILTTLLNEMDGISSKSNSGVLVLACTNRLMDLDAALLRPGRLEEHIELKLPTVEDIREILEAHLSSVPVAKNVNLEEFAEVFFELSATGADVEGVCRDACSIAIRALDESDSVDLTHEMLNAALRNWKR